MTQVTPLYEEDLKDYIPVPVKGYCGEVKLLFKSKIPTDLPSVSFMNLETKVAVVMEPKKNNQIWIFNELVYQIFPPDTSVGNIILKTSQDCLLLQINNVTAANISKSGVKIFPEFDNLYNDTLIVARST